MARKRDPEKKRGPEPERLKISGDPAEGLDRLLNPRPVPGGGDWIEEPEDGDKRLRYGRYAAVVEIGQRVRGKTPLELHLVPGGGWRIRGKAPLPSTDRIIRVQWMGELPG